MTSRIWRSPIFTHFKKHKCFKCGEVLSVVKTSKMVNSKSPEARDYDFSLGDVNTIGNVKFIWDEFECPKCGTRISIKEMREIEKEKSRMNKHCCI